jgi:putative addiction module component (TIGR02574 family)
MSATMKSLGIDQLSVDDRMLLMEEIWESIAANPDDVPVSNAQKQDLQARLAAYQDNPKAGTPWEEVKARLRSKP